ncbi:unnamed protein product [Cuscuta epithymum]|uniref:asparagine--tRNA ligase n=1 Tax=Cuscuta epithymum TaxID=186058 RepID=A0AAV0FU20_9ASTE|nr:unnamed protein product [Cuscuta epithymum]
MASSETAVGSIPSTNKYTNRVILKTIFDREDGGLGYVGQRVVIGGWVRSSEERKKEDDLQPVEGSEGVSCVEVILSSFPLIRSIIKVFRGEGHSRIPENTNSDVVKRPPPSFMILKVSDGSSVNILRVVVDSELAIPSQIMPTGTCILAEGILQQPASTGNHAIELKVDKVLHLGTVDHNNYPLSKKPLSLMLLRDWTHFRTRTTTVASVMRIRDAITQAFHTFFQDNDFLYVHMPTITNTSTGGSSKEFIVTTQPLTNYDNSHDLGLEGLNAAFKKKSKVVEELEKSQNNKETLVAEKQKLERIKGLISRAKAIKKSTFRRSHPKEDEISLTGSGRLHLESQACALGKAYTSGPRFQVQESELKKSLPEMLIVETEIAFSKLVDAMNCADDLLKFICKSILENSTQNVKFLSKRVDKSITERLKFMTSCSLERISYSDAVKVLKQATENKFGKAIEWGVPLNDDHTSYLVDEIYKRPIIIYDHPKKLKPFNVRLNDDAETVAAFDIVLPKVGTVISGSQSEERLKTLNSRIEEVGLPKQQYEWYLDLRRYGTVEHSGFSLMFDSLVLFATGINNILDVVPFPVIPSKTSA